MVEECAAGGEAHLHLVHDEVGEVAEGGGLAGGEGAGFVVEDAEGAEVVSVAGDQWCARVGADLGA